MKYQIKRSFYSPNGQYSGLAGREIDEKLYNQAIEWGYAERVEIVGYIPATFRSDEELDAEIAELLAEKEKRDAEKAKVLDVEETTSEKTEEVSEDDSESGDAPKPKKRGRKPKNN